MGNKGLLAKRKYRRKIKYPRDNRNSRRAQIQETRANRKAHKYPGAKNKISKSKEAIAKVVTLFRKTKDQSPKSKEQRANHKQWETKEFQRRGNFEEKQNIHEITEIIEEQRSKRQERTGKIIIIQEQRTKISKSKEAIANCNSKEKIFKS